MKYVGKSVLKREHIRRITGRGKYLDDIEIPGIKPYYVAFLRSPYAHARIKKIDFSDAINRKGVIGVYTGDDLKEYSIPYWMHLPNMKEFKRYPLAVGKVKYYGEPVVAVIAEDKYAAEDAIEYINIDYEELPVIKDPFEALNTNVKIHDDLDNNVIYYEKYVSDEKIIDAINNSDLVIEERVKFGRTLPLPLETRGVFAYFDGERLNVHMSTQFPHVVRNLLGEILKFPESKIRVTVYDVGGGFGPKSAVFQDEVTVCALALKTGLPLKWVESRIEDFLTTGHERDQIHDVRAGFSKDGKIIGIYDKIVADYGIGGWFWTEVQPVMVAAVSLPGPYKFKHYGYEINAVVTNKAPITPNNGFGRPVAPFVMERILDIAAQELKIDPVEIRMTNLIDKDDFPYTNPAKVAYDSGNYKEALKKLLEIMDYHRLREEQERLRKKGKYIGIGISTYSEYTAPPSLRLYQVLGWEVGGYEKAIVKIDTDGKVIVQLATQDTGQGHYTIFAQIAAEELGLNINDVEVVEGDTDKTPYGFGSWASRSTATAGNAIVIASRRLKERIKRIAAKILNCSIEDIVIEEGKVFNKEKPEKYLTLRDIAKIAYRIPPLLPEGEKIGLEEEAVYESAWNTTLTSYAWHGAVVEVDPETGMYNILKYFVVHDSGVIVNPLSAEAQVVGMTIAHGLLQALSEIKYNEQGVLITSSLLDYVVPTSEMSPLEFKVEHLETPSPTPGGFKGLGEGGAIGGPAAIINAIADALSEFNIKITKIPLEPQDVWALLTKQMKK